MIDKLLHDDSAGAYRAFGERKRMAKEFAKKFYNRKGWELCRDSYIADRIMIDGGLCEECHEAAGYIVHHKLLLTEDNINNPEIALNHENLEYVCKKCHDKFDDHGIGNKRKCKPLFKFDEDGQPISLREIDRVPPKKY